MPGDLPVGGGDDDLREVRHERRARPSPTSAPSGSTGTSRQPRTSRPSSATMRSSSEIALARSSGSAGRNARPVAYARTGAPPSGDVLGSGSAKSTVARSSASGTWSMIPAPSPLVGSLPAAPRWSRLCRTTRASRTIAWLATPRVLATAPTPQASCSYAGS